MGEGRREGGRREGGSRDGKKGKEGIQNERKKRGDRMKEERKG